MEHRERWEVKEKWVPWEILAIKENLVILGLKVSMVFPAKRVREVRSLTCTITFWLHLVNLMSVECFSLVFGSCVLFVCNCRGHFVRRESHYLFS